MAGLDPAIHVFVAAKQDVDARLKAGHDSYNEIYVDRYLIYVTRGHPRSPEGCSAGVLSVNGERRLRA
jgi:hypothetical protein